VRDGTLQNHSDKALDDLARMFNPYIRGWINYYSHFYQSTLDPTLRRIDAALARWAQKKFKRLRQSRKARGTGSRKWLTPLLDSLPTGRFCMSTLNAGSRMSRETHVRFWESVGVRLPRATHLPLYRQSEMYAREGIDLDRSTLSGWVGGASELLSPLVEALRKHVLAGTKLHADDRGPQRRVHCSVS